LVLQIVHMLGKLLNFLLFLVKFYFVCFFIFENCLALVAVPGSVLVQLVLELLNFLVLVVLSLLKHLYFVFSLF
jgi:hypothetical protein